MFLGNDSTKTCESRFVRLTLLGSREENQPGFLYRLRSVSSRGIEIRVIDEPGSDLEEGERVALHLPFRSNGEFFDHGVVLVERWDDRGQICELALGNPVVPRYPVFLTTDGERNCPEMLRYRLLEDLVYFQKGVAVYFDHLAPYFTRHNLYPIRETSPFCGAFLPRIRARLARHLQTLEGLTERAAASVDGFLDERDLERLREAVRLETHVLVSTSAFESAAVIPYLTSIRRLEHQLYSNFNALVLLHEEHHGSPLVEPVYACN